MKVRICPLCDSEMKKSHYCDTCKSFIWRPEVLDIHYNAQERNRGEADCAYGAEHDQKDHDEVYGETEKKKTRPLVRPTKTASNMDENKRKAGGCLSKIVLVIIILNALLGVVGRHMGDLIENLTDGNVIDGIENIIQDIGDEDSWNQDEEDDENGYRDLSDAELSDYPDGCNAYAHFDVKGDVLGSTLEAWAKAEYGMITDLSVSTSEDNYIYTYDGTETVYLEKNDFYTINDTCYVVVYSDSVTGDVHSVTASLEDRERVSSFLVTALSALSVTTDMSEQELQNNCDDFAEQINEDGISTEVNGINIYASQSSNGEIWLTVDA